ncbi:uncharacterized protein LOC132606160 isoform X1 [Lycium barbarum]|uniref:uncharacterized protein LOC132606160 isoform X1 n=1 Tax=Lycium barbarum TaxID=112863 RepID=UPI00293EE172|nr:uncharacterized protein LOC132606160 isoform X1 [Lycium barbarum]
MPTKSLFPQSSDIVKQYIQEIETSAIGKERGQGLKNATMSASQGMRMIHKNSMVLEIGYSFSKGYTSTDQVKQCKKVETSPGAIGMGREQTPRSLCSSLGVSENEMESFHENARYANQRMQTPSKITRSNSTMSPSQRMRIMDKNPMVLEKEHVQTNISLPPSTDQVMQHYQTVE